MANTHKIIGDEWHGRDVDDDSYIVSKLGAHTDWEGRSRYGCVAVDSEGRIICEGEYSIAWLSDDEQELFEEWLAEGTHDAGKVDESVIALIAKARTIISDLSVVIETLSAKVGA